MRLTTLAPPDDDFGPPDALATIAVVYSLPDAAVTQTTLRAYGIPSCAIGSALASVQWYYMQALGGIEIRVPKRLQETAIALIQDLAAPRTRAEITAEIKAHGGPYIRKRILIAHTTRAICLAPLLLPPPNFAHHAYDGAGYFIGYVAAFIGWLILLALTFFSI